MQPPGRGNSYIPALCARIRFGQDVIELFTVTVRFDNTNDVTLSELRVELMYAGNDTADRFFHAADPPNEDSRATNPAVVVNLAGVQLEASENHSPRAVKRAVDDGTAAADLKWLVAG